MEPQLNKFNRTSFCLNTQKKVSRILRIYLFSTLFFIQTYQHIVKNHNTVAIGGYPTLTHCPGVPCPEAKIKKN